MRAVVQRAIDAAVLVDGLSVGQFQGLGMLALVGVTHSDTPTESKRLAAKLAGLRIFDGPDGREASISDLGLPILVVSQFTLYGETNKGRRPTWDRAAPAAIAEPLVQLVVDELRNLGSTVTTGIFGADMRVESTNSGPMTLILDV